MDPSCSFSNFYLWAFCQSNTVIFLLIGTLHCFELLRVASLPLLQQLSGLISLQLDPVQLYQRDKQIDCFLPPHCKMSPYLQLELIDLGVERMSRCLVLPLQVCYLPLEHSTLLLRPPPVLLTHLEFLL